jgi:hypothetical protein
LENASGTLCTRTPSPATGTTADHSTATHDVPALPAATLPAPVPPSTTTADPPPAPLHHSASALFNLVPSPSDAQPVQPPVRTTVPPTSPTPSKLRLRIKPPSSATSSAAPPTGSPRPSHPTPPLAVPPQPTPPVPTPALGRAQQHINFALPTPPGPPLNTTIPPPQPHNSDARGDRHMASRGRHRSNNNDHQDAPRGTRARSPPPSTRRGTEDSRSRHQGRSPTAQEDNRDQHQERATTAWLYDSETPDRTDGRHRRTSLSPPPDCTPSPDWNPRRRRRDDKDDRGGKGDKGRKGPPQIQGERQRWGCRTIPLTRGSTSQDLLATRLFIFPF